MFFEVEHDVAPFLQEELMHVVGREFLTLPTDFHGLYGLRSVPTHTEDGIPIRKLYVSNLPPKTTRTELFGVFAQYGFIKSCWLRMGDRGPNRSPTPTYAFVTFSDPADAHKALQAPFHERTLRGRSLRISPADSWHQPAEDSDGYVQWRPSALRFELENILTDSPGEQPNEVSTQELLDTPELENNGSTAARVDDVQQEEVNEIDTDEGYDIQDILNTYCLQHVLSFVPLRDLIRSERVSKRWQMMIQEYICGIRVFKTSWWQHVPVTLTTAVLRRVLQRVGKTLLRLHIDHNWSALNDRTAHTVGKFCPHLEELKVVGMHTKNWNPLVYGCKNLRRLIFVSCNKLTDSSLVHIVKSDCPLEYLAVANNTHVTGLFLTGSNIQRITALSFYNCYNLQGAVLCAAIDLMPNLTILRLDVCLVTMWKIIPLIIKKVPKLEELSLSEYTSLAVCIKPYENESFCEALSNLKELRTLNLSRNIYITNAVLKQVARSCIKLESLNVSSCNSKKSYPNTVSRGAERPSDGNSYSKGVSDDGIVAVCRSCINLKHLDVSYLAGITDSGLSYAARLPSLTTLTSRGNATLSSQPFALCISSCRELIEIDVCGSDGISEEVVEATIKALVHHPRPVVLWLAATPAALIDDLPMHKLLTVNLDEDRSNPHLRPDFVDRLLDDSSEDSFDDIYEQDDFHDFLGHDDDYVDNELDDYGALLHMGLPPPDIVMF